MSVASVDEKLYEGMFVLDSSKYAADPETVTNEVVGLLEKAGATVVAHRPWQDARLAYPIEKQRKGLHYLTYFRLSGSDGLTDVARSCRLTDTVLRHLVIRHEESIFEASVNALSAHQSSGEAEEAAAGETKESSSDSDSDDDNSDEKNEDNND